MRFELEAGWGDTAISVRQAYLNYRVTHHIALDPHTHTHAPQGESQDLHTTPHNPTQGQLVGEMVFALLDTGLKKVSER